MQVDALSVFAKMAQQMVLLEKNGGDLDAPVKAKYARKPPVED